MTGRRLADREEQNVGANDVRLAKRLTWLAVSAVLWGACGSGSPVEKKLDLTGTDLTDARTVAGDVLLEVGGPDLRVETGDTFIPCLPACDGKQCGEADGCGGFCYLAEDCDDGIECTTDFCIPEEGEGCRHLPLSHLCPGEPPCRRGECDLNEGCLLIDLEQELCDDADLCTTDDRCQAGECAGDPLDVDSCDDGNPCTADDCDSQQGCLHTAVEGECTMGTDWLDGHCDEGLCVPDAVLAVPCQEDADCALFDNEDLCDGRWLCGEDKKCLFSTDSVPVCPTEADEVCLKNVCNPGSGECQMLHDSEGLPCTDGDACSLQDVCVEGVCVPGVLGLLCDDGNPCTADICDPVIGCGYEVQEGLCDDGNDCTHEDHCVAEMCVGTHFVCDDGLPCTEDLCDGEGGCTADDVTPGWCRVAGACLEEDAIHPTNSCLRCSPESDDIGWSPTAPGSPCTLPHAVGGCADGVCFVVECALGFLDCETAEEDGCEVDGDNDPLHCGDCDSACDAGLVCSEGECLPTCPNGVEPCAGSCPDTTSDAGHCGGCDVVCSTESPGLVGICGAGECDQEPCPEGEHNLDGLPGNGCEYQCELGAEELCDGLDNDCNGAVDEESCDDGVTCTVDLCNTLSGCQNAPGDALCDDGNECTSHLCDLELGCVATDLDGPCDDDDICTTGDLCQGGACVGTLIDGCCLLDVACDDGNPCTVDACDPESHQCLNSAGALEGTPCDGDGDGCTIETCQDGLCASAAEVDCPAPAGPCQVVECLASGPLSFACIASDLTGGEPCDDGLFCTAGEGCNEGGQCVGGSALDCSVEAGPCHSGICDEFNDQCVMVPRPDDFPCNADGDGCTVDDSCQDGECAVGSAPDCDAAGDDCSFGICLSLEPDKYQCGLAPRPADTACEDGLACTQSDGCDGAGSCVGGPPPECPGGESACLVTECDEGSGGCIEEPVEDGSVCDDGDECTLIDLCSNGACFGGESGCLDRKVNTFSTHQTYHSPLERYDAVPMGPDRAVALWRASGQTLRAQILDDELTKLRPELSLSDEWPPAPGGCAPILGRQALAANADGDWLVVSSYKWQKFTGYSCGYTKKTCLFQIYYVLSASILDRDGEVKQEWKDIIPSSLVYQTQPHWSCGSCNCGAVYGSQPNQVAGDDMRAVPFSDGSFGLLHIVTALPYKFYRLSPTLEFSAPIALDLGASPGAPALCSLAGDGLAVVYDDGTGTLQVLYLDQDGAYVGGPVAVSATEEGHQDRPACARLSGGKLAVAFSSCANEGPCEVHAQILKTGGAKYGQTVTASDAGDGVQAYDVRVESTSGGGFALAWHQAIGDADGWSSMVRVYGSDIAPKTDAMRLNVQEVGNQLRPVLARIGASILALFEHPVGGVSQDLYLRFFTEDGDPQSGAPERRVPEVTGDSPQHGDATANGDGFAVVWDADAADGDERGVLLRLFLASGKPAGEEQVVNQTVQGNQTEPAAAYLADSDRLLVAWTSLSMGDGEDVFARLFDGAGEAVGGEFRVNTQVPGDQSQVSATALEGDIFAVVWTGYSSDFAGTDVFARIVDEKGDFAGGPFLVHDSFLNDQEAPEVVPVGGDQPGFIVTWTHAAGSPGGVYVRRFDLEGQPVGGAEALVDEFGQPQEATLDANESGTIAVLCWRVGDKVLCQQLDGDLAMVGAQFEAANGTQPGAPAVLFRGDDRVWVLQDEVGRDAEGRAVRRLDLDPGGNPHGPFGLMNVTEDGDQTDPFATRLPAGGAVVGWTGSGQPDGDGVFMRVLK